MYQECYVTGERKYGTKGVFDLSTIILGEDDNLRNWHERSAFQLVAVKAVNIFTLSQPFLKEQLLGSKYLFSES